MNNSILEAQEWRYAVKKFNQEKKIATSDWEILEKCLILTPSSYGLQPWKFIIVQNDDVKQKLRTASWNQSQVTDCSHYVIFALCESMTEQYVADYMQSIADSRNIAIETLAGFQKGIIGDVVHGARSKVIQEWAARQCYIALGNFMTSAAVMGIDTCPMEGFDPTQYNNILELNGTGYKSAVACAAGYRHNEDPQAKRAKVRFSKTKIIDYR